MNREELAKELLAGLLELEKAGDLVITSTIPFDLADQLCSKIIRKWADEFLDIPPNEVVIEDGAKYSTKHLQAMLSIEESEARSTVDKFIGQLQANRTAREVADLLAHQGAQEIALGAYFCVYLQRGEYYSRDYLDWRAAAYVTARARDSLG